MSIQCPFCKLVTYYPIGLAASILICQYYLDCGNTECTGIFEVEKKLVLENVTYLWRN